MKNSQYHLILTLLWLILGQNAFPMNIIGLVGATTNCIIGAIELYRESKK
jgi:hypothetical protein